MAVTLKPSGIQRLEGTAYCSEGILVIQDVHGRAEGGGRDHARSTAARVCGGGGVNVRSVAGEQWGWHQVR